VAKTTQQCNQQNRQTYLKVLTILLDLKLYFYQTKLPGTASVGEQLAANNGAETPNAAAAQDLTSTMQGSQQGLPGDLNFNQALLSY
jgi:hypothetical protein